MGRLDEAQARYQLALRLRVAALGGDHPEVAMSHNSLGLVAIERGELDVAVKELGEARRILASAQHGELPIVLANLGLLAVREGKFEEGRGLLEDAVARYRAVLPARHERLARALIDASDAAVGAGDVRRARVLIAEAKAAIPEEAGERFVKEVEEREEAMRERVRPSTRPPGGLAQDERGWNGSS
jgi:tetratricopeptide (TPR) repeat protein